MAKYKVRQTLTFYWEVNANSKREAIEIAEDMGEINSTSSSYTNKTAILI